MASLPEVRDFLAQYHDVISADEAALIRRETNRYMVGGLIPKGCLELVFGIYHPLFIKFEASPAPEIPAPGEHKGVI